MTNSYIPFRIFCAMARFTGTSEGKSVKINVICYFCSICALLTMFLIGNSILTNLFVCFVNDGIEQV